LHIFHDSNLTYLKSVKSQTGSQWKERERKRERRIESKKEIEKERRIKKEMQSKI
jgi:hypothetical protein